MRTVIPMLSLSVTGNMAKFNRRAFLMSGVSALSMSLVMTQYGRVGATGGWLLKEGDV